MPDAEPSEPSGCVDYGSVTVCYGPRMKEIRRDELGERWCFTCRKRRPFVFLVTASVEPSYYGPSVGVECDRGHYDGDCFPGRYREWEEVG